MWLIFGVRTYRVHGVGVGVGVVAAYCIEQQTPDEDLGGVSGRPSVFSYMRNSMTSVLKLLGLVQFQSL